MTFNYPTDLVPRITTFLLLVCSSFAYDSTGIGHENFYRNASLQPRATDTGSSKPWTAASHVSPQESSHNAQQGLGPYIKAGLGEGLIYSSTSSSTLASLQPLVTINGGNEEDASTKNDLPMSATSFITPGGSQSEFESASSLSMSSSLGSRTTLNASVAEILRSPTSAMSNRSTTTSYLKPPLAQSLNYTTSTRQTIGSNLSQNSSRSTGSPSSSTKDINSAYSCYMSSGAWSASSAKFAWANMVTYSETLSALCSSSPNPSATDVYTLCDGIPRVNNSQFDHQTCAITMTFSSATKTFTSSPPACSIAKSDCASIFDDMENLYYGEPCIQQEAQCFVGANAARLLYWPAEKVTGSLCDSACPNPYYNGTNVTEVTAPEMVTICSASRSVIMPSEAGLVTAVLDGHTLTSPTAYYSFDAVSAYNYSPAGLSWLPMTAPQGPTMSAVGKFLTNVIVPVMSSDVSTVPAGYTMLNAIDWSNLNAPVPLLAYIEGWQCWSSTNCSVVYQDDYAPMLAVPLQALNLDPAWSTCLPLEGGVYDPPHALQAAAAAASPTNTFTNAQTTFPITRTSPEPGHTASTILPTSVAIPGEGGTSQPDRGSGDTSDPGNRGGSTSPGAGEKSNPDPGSSDVTGEGNDGSPDSSPGSAPEDSNGRRPDPNSDGSGPDVDTSSDPRPQDPGQRVGGAIVSIVTYSGGNSVPNPGTDDVGNAFDPRPDSGLDDSDAGAAGSIPSSLDHNASPDPQTAPEPAPDQADNEQPESSPAHAIASILGLPNLLAGGTTSPSDKTPEYGGSGGSYNDGDESFDEFGAAAFDSGSESDSGNTSGEPYAFAFAGTRPIFLDPALREAIIVAGQTISPGDPATTIDGTRISVAAGGYMVIGTSVVAIPTATTQADAQNNDASEPGGRWTTFTGTNGALITASEIAGGTLIAAGQTLSIGGPAIEVDGRIVSAASNGLVFVDGSHTSTLAFPETTAPPSLEAALTMADSDIITAFEEPGRSGVVVVGEHTLSLGDIATMDGETISDGPAGLVVLDGTETSRVTFSTAQSGGGGGEAVATRSESDEAARASSSKSDASLAPTVSSSGTSMEKFPRQLSFLWVSTIITAVAVGFGT